MKAHARKLGGGQPLELGVIGGGAVPVTVGEVDQRSADANDGGQVQRVVRRRVGLGPKGHRMGKGVCGIRHAPAHRGRARAVRLDETPGMTAGLVVQQIGDVALLPKLDRAGAVAGGKGVAHPGKQCTQFVRIRMREFHELEAVGAGRVFCADGGARCGVGEGTHGDLLSGNWIEDSHGFPATSAQSGT